MKKSIKREIQEAEVNITRKENQHDETRITLESQINTLNRFAKILIWVGAVLFIVGVILYFLNNLNEEQLFGLNLLGDYMSGAVASVWSLVGLLYIYVAFLGQKQQLLSQQLEIAYNRLEVKYTRLELKGQKEEMEVQNRTLNFNSLKIPSSTY